LDLIIRKDEIYYHDEVAEKTIKDDTTLIKQADELIKLIKNYKIEYDYTLCSKALDGYSYTIKLWDNENKLL
jgi:hypothetical protein